MMSNELYANVMLLRLKAKAVKKISLSLKYPGINVFTQRFLKPNDARKPIKSKCSYLNLKPLQQVMIN
jgi:hypothetical protein